MARSKKRTSKRARAGSLGRLILGDSAFKVVRGDPAWRIKYETYMSSDAWRRTRARFFAATGNTTCRGCSRTDEVALHHRCYDRLGTERLDDLVPLCPMCHQGAHDLHRTGRHSLEQATDLVIQQQAPMGEPSKKPTKPEFIPANQRGARSLGNGRLLSSLDWRDEVRSLRGLTNAWHPDD
jgi:hypothetical protein